MAKKGKKLPASKTEYAWWFSDTKSGATSNQRKRLKPGSLLTFPGGDIQLCMRGFHSSPTPRDARQYHRGPFLWLVRIPSAVHGSAGKFARARARDNGITIRENWGTDKSVSDYREHLEVHDIDAVEWHDIDNTRVVPRANELLALALTKKEMLPPIFFKKLREGIKRGEFNGEHLDLLQDLIPSHDFNGKSSIRKKIYGLVGVTSKRKTDKQYWAEVVALFKKYKP